MVTGDDHGNYSCGDCGHTWKARKRYQWWPIRFRWQRNSALRFFDWHGWQTGWDGIEQRVFGQTLHVGSLKICLGTKPAAESGGEES